MQESLYDLHMCFLSDMIRRGPLAACLEGKIRVCRGHGSPLPGPNLPAKQALRSGPDCDRVTAML